MGTLHVWNTAGMDYDADVKMILTAPASENWKRPVERPRITWLNTVQRDLRAYNLTLTKPSTWLRTALCGGWCLRTRTVWRYAPDSACQKRKSGCLLSYYGRPM